MQLPKKKNFLLNLKQNGFSLVEIMIAAGIMSTLLLYLYQTLGNQQKSARKIEVRLEADSIVNDIRQTLGVRDSCIASLSGKNATNTPPGDTAANITRTRHKIPSSAVIIDKYLSNTNFNSAVQYGSARVRIISYSLSSTDPNDPSIGMVAGTPYGATNLIITFRYGAAEPIIQRKIRMDVVTVSPANRTIVSCSSTGLMSDFDTRYVNVLGDTMTGDLIMDLNSNIQILGTGTIIMSSDKRLKKNIQSLTNVTSKINKLRPVSYRWKQDNKPAIGLVAQEVQSVFPELVHQRDDSDLLTIDYLQLSPFIVKGLQETNQENVLLRKKMKSLNNELNQVKEYLCQKDPQSSLCVNFDLKR